MIKYYQYTSIENGLGGYFRINTPQEFLTNIVEYRLDTQNVLPPYKGGDQT